MAEVRRNMRSSREYEVEVIGSARILRRLMEIGAPFNNETFSEVGNFIIASILQRTSEGKDYKGRLFKPYTPRYRMFREEKGLPTDKVDLMVSGSMLSAMTFKTSNDRVSVFFQNTSDRNDVKNPLKAFSLNRTRKFFALSSEDIRSIAEIFRRRLQEVIGSEE